MMVTLTTVAADVDIEVVNVTQPSVFIDQNILNRDQTEGPISNRSYLVNMTDSVGPKVDSQTHFYFLHGFHVLLHMVFLIIIILLVRWVKAKLPLRRPLPSLPGRELSPFECALADPEHEINRVPLENTYLEPEV